jgi:hypothetical protein
MEVNDTSSDDDPPLALYAYDRKTQTTRTISPKGYDCFQPSVYGERLFCAGRKQGSDSSSTDPVFNIYSMDMEGGDFRVEYKGRRDFSCRREKTD